ncbi:hypothetical protein [Staphylococcus gallinarum]|uniref:hypothetical protein n=1 Tax=Staphylococcus gallinarum TaxID=1293 RepID=UPI001E52EEF2|nr:hypothetical protein [Staphylococcus gallinarum]MCD8787429.1 hypothetical protein [Staphylococcus gallinarum]MCD8845235.1 hypothetical protein [Staphylococcus gallinarum]
MNLDKMYYYLKEAYEKNKIFDMIVTKKELTMIDTLQEQGKLEYIGPYHENVGVYITIILVK